MAAFISSPVLVQIQQWSKSSKTLNPPLLGSFEDSSSESVRAEVADANPKHAEFIVDSPLEWYADGPIDDAMMESDHAGGLGFGGLGLGEEMRMGLWMIVGRCSV